MTIPTEICRQALRSARLTCYQLWERYFELGGMGTVGHVDACLRHATIPTEHDHDLIAHAMNERFSELGRNHPIAYARSTP